jgi:ubiquinol oxidase
VEARVVEEDGFESSADDAELPAKGLEKWIIIPVEKAFNVLATEAVIMVLDAFYAQRAYARFYVLETIARVPYFAFVSVLHMYESFGWWRRADYLKVHFAESWNELHHLLTMEVLNTLSSLSMWSVVL